LAAATAAAKASFANAGSMPGGTGISTFAPSVATRKQTMPARQAAPLPSRA